MPQLSNQESRGFTHVYKLTYTDVVALGTAVKSIAKIPAGGIVTNAAFVVNTAAVGPTNLTIGVGSSSSDPTDFIIKTTDVDGLTKVTFNTGTALDTEPGYLNNTASAVDVYLKFDGTTSTLTAGEWLVALTILDPAGLANNA